jgi:hypothetical protein
MPESTEPRDTRTVADGTIPSFLDRQDEEFLQQYASCRRALTSLREVEQEIIHPDKIHPTGSLYSEVAQDIEGKINTIITEAGPDAIEIVLKHAFETTLTLRKQQDPVLPVIGQYVESCLFVSKEKTQKVLAPLIRVQGVREREVADTFLTYRSAIVSMRIDHATTKEDRFTYYDKEIILNGLTELDQKLPLTACEVEFGVLALYRPDGTVVGVCNILPQIQNEMITDKQIQADVFDKKDLMQHLYFRGVGSFEADAEQFFADLPTFFNETMISASPLYNTVFSKWYGAPGANKFPTEIKYALWKSFATTAPGYTPQLDKAAKHIISIDGDSGPVVLAGLMSNKEDLIAGFGKELDEMSQKEIRNVFTHYGLLERYIVEEAILMTPPELRNIGPERQQRIQMIQPVARSILLEACRSVSHATSPDDCVLRIDQHTRGVIALFSMIQNIYHKFQQADVPLQTFSSQEMDEIRISWTRYPEAEMTNLALMGEWMSKAMLNQKNIKEADRQAWLWSFYQHVVSLNIYGEKAKIYTDVSGLEPVRIANAIRDLLKQHLLPPDYRYITVGCGDGKRVDEPMMKLLQEAHEAPTEIVGIDMSPQADDMRWHDMKFLQEKIETVLDNHHEYRNYFHFLAFIGSPLNNMNLLNVQMLYMASAAGLLVDGGIMMMDTGSGTTAGELNVRAARMESFNRLFPHKPYGSTANLPEYVRPGDDPGEVGALLYPDPLLPFLAWAQGFELIGPLGNPKQYQEMIQKYQDVVALQAGTKNNQNALQMPWYMANPDEYKPGEPVNARIVYFFRKNSIPRTDHPIMQMLQAFLT